MIELNELAKKFQTQRNKYPGKKINYPPRLQKSVAELAKKSSSKFLATELGVSNASIRSWARKYQKPEAPAMSDIIPISVNHDTSSALRCDSEELTVKLVSMEVKVPTSKLAETLTELLKTLGRPSC